MVTGEQRKTTLASQTDIDPNQPPSLRRPNENLCSRTFWNSPQQGHLSVGKGLRTLPVMAMHVLANTPHVECGHVKNGIYKEIILLVGLPCLEDPA